MREENYIFDVFDDGVDTSQSLLQLPVPAKKLINLPSTSNSPSLLGRMTAYAEEKEMNEKVTWLEPATKLLISLVEELRPKVGKTLKLKTKKKMWEFIMETMISQGYIYSSTQIENKYKSLERTYKTKLQHNKKTGRDRVSCQYEKELNHMFKGRDNIFPQYTLEATGIGTTQKELEEEAGIHDHEKMEDENTSTNITIEEELEESPKQKKSKVHTNTALKELSLLRKEKNVFNEKQLEAYERRTAEISRKNELLEELIKVLAKKE